MYICNSCNKRFKKAHVTLTSMGSYYECPSCDSSNYRELEYEELKHSEKTLEQRVFDIEKKLRII